MLIFFVLYMYMLLRERGKGVYINRMVHTTQAFTGKVFRVSIVGKFGKLSGGKLSPGEFREIR